MNNKTSKATDADSSIILSYLDLRKAIGFLGAGLPVVVWLGAYLVQQTGLQFSVSDYYYTVMRNVFVGALWAIGVFLLFYKGYDRIDALASRLSGIFAIGVSLFPTTPDNPSADAVLIGYIHLTFAALFFITLGCTSIFLFTKKAGDQNAHPITRKKRQRNLVYYVCGGLMLACILGIILFLLFFNKAGTALEEIHPVFWLEAVAVIAFGVSWMIKGETLLKDEDVPLRAEPALKLTKQESRQRRS